MDDVNGIMMRLRKAMAGIEETVKKLPDKNVVEQIHDHIGTAAEALDELNFAVVEEAASEGEG